MSLKAGMEPFIAPVIEELVLLDGWNCWINLVLPGTHLRHYFLKDQRSFPGGRVGFWTLPFWSSNPWLYVWWTESTPIRNFWKRQWWYPNAISFSRKGRWDWGQSSNTRRETTEEETWLWHSVWLMVRPSGTVVPSDQVLVSVFCKRTY